MPPAETPAAIVDEFIRRITGGDLDGALDLCAEDIEYDNVPMPTCHGKEEARAFLGQMAGEGIRIEWTVHRQVADGPVVLNERTDEFWFGDLHIVLPVAGIFEVHDGLIRLWRDYFDLRTFEQQMAGEPPGT
jgi:limonene-1,2-epoxide hydrolase